MLTPPNCCNCVALCLKDTTCCFHTLQSRSGTAESGFRHASLTEKEHKRPRSCSAFFCSLLF